jgi:3-oxoacyl-(acyl-carrier-protein) synthase
MNTRPKVFVTGLGVICAGASDIAELRRLLLAPARRFQSSTVFPVAGESAALPVAQVSAPDLAEADVLPRTHRLAMLAARQAIGDGPAPDAIVLGTTTGGILTTEFALQAGVTSPAAYRFHGLDTVADYLAETLGVRGPVLTISTACSSAAVALSVASALLRAGLARRVLAGGADSLCRLTFHGFRQLQLVAARGATPLDVNRAGMTVGEGAGFLLLESDPGGRSMLAQVAGTGLSCDAYHATSPHPEGRGAALAMQRALAEAGFEPSAIDYINLHGTGTVDNDAAEARAIKQVFGDKVPALSSTKGLTGHTLAAAGAIEGVIAVLALTDGLLPANTGLETVDPKLDVAPVRQPTRSPVRAVLSNSFGFGGNNACVVLCQPSQVNAVADARTDRPLALPALRVAAAACLSARGALDDTWAALVAAEKVAGFVPDACFAKAAPAAFIRRLKRLPRLMLALAQTAHTASGRSTPPDLLAVGTAWGPLAETQDFLRKLSETGDQFSSPMDFIGSVHNAPAGQVALLLGAQAPNLTCSAGDRSFEQALLCASLGMAAGARSALVMAAEAYDAQLSPLLDAAAATSPLASDGGAAFVLVPDDDVPGARVRWLGESGGGDGGTGAIALLAAIVAPDRYDAIAVSVPAALGAAADETLARLAGTLPDYPLVPYRDDLGQHASVSATATAIAARAVCEGVLPLGPIPLALPRRRLLLLQLGRHATAIEVFA